MRNKNEQSQLLPMPTGNEELLQRRIRLANQIVRKQILKHKERILVLYSTLKNSQLIPITFQFV